MSFESRWAALGDPRPFMNKIGDTRSNPALLLKEIIEGNNEAKMAQLESHAAEVAAERDLKDKIEKAKKRRHAGDEGINMMLALNMSKSLDHASSKAMNMALDEIADFLERGMLDEAKVEIEALNPLPANVDEADRTAMVDYLTAKIIEIG